MLFEGIVGLALGILVLILIYRWGKREGLI